MNDLTENLDSIANIARMELTAKDEAREKALPLCRDAIRNCSMSIRAIHRQEFEQSTGLLKKAHDAIKQAEQVFAAHSEFSNTGFIRDAQKEFAEGCTFLAMVTGERLPSAGSLEIDTAAYLNGLGEAVGELRRYVLNSVRQGDFSRCEELLLAMDEIYNVLVTIDFPDAITGGLRRTTDMARGQKELEKKLISFKQDT